MKILFVCTGNVFRSISAEYLLKKYLKDNNLQTIEADSAGIHPAIGDEMSPWTKKHLQDYGVKVVHRDPKRLTIELLDTSDVIVAMADYHQAFIKKYFSIDVPLFNEVCTGEKTSVLDIDDAYDTYGENEWKTYTGEIVRHIHDSMPSFVKNVNKYVKQTYQKPL